MTLLVFFTIYLIIRFETLVTCVDIHNKPHNFCYTEPECDENSKCWDDLCRQGISQSPIDLRNADNSTEDDKVFLPLRHLEAAFFFMQNNGHTINIDFPNENYYGDHFFFPGYGLDNQTIYRLSNIHFHWGSQNSKGSEHSINGREYSMEMHFVHYNADYLSPAKAIASGNKNALAVVGIFLDVNPMVKYNIALNPIIRHLSNVSEKHSYWIKVEKPLNFYYLLPKEGEKLYTYRGSLTTPPCKEQVTWYIFKEPERISPSDVEEFRKVLGGNNRPLKENHRKRHPYNPAQQIKIKTITYKK